MVAIKAHEAARALAKPDPRWRVWLIYGPDAGLVSERVQQIAQAALGSSHDDPFRFVLLEGDDIAADPLRLSDEANAIGLFGGEKVIRVSRTGKALSPAVDPLLAHPPEGALVVIEAGELTARNPLRVACEKSPSAIALPCYGDDGRALGELVDTTLREQGITIDRSARELLLASLGSDRLVSRQELQKLLLYLGEARRVELSDIEACMGDSSVRETDTLVDACFAGHFPLADSAWQRLRSEGMDPSVLLGALMRHGFLLLQAQLKIEDGQSRQHVSDALRLPYPRKASASTALAQWDQSRLVSALRALSQTVAEARKNSALASDLAQRAVMDVSRKAKLGLKNQ
jgi:DNA polymerase III subunit delta